jgi:hypothetical protein
LLIRLTEPVLQRISRADDYITWTLTRLPFVAGMAVLNVPSAFTRLRDHAL